MCVSRDQAEAANTGVGFCKNTCYMVGYFPPTVNRPGAEFSHPRPELKRGVIRGMTTRHGIELTWVWVLAPLARASGRAILLGQPYSPLVNQG